MSAGEKIDRKQLIKDFLSDKYTNVELQKKYHVSKSTMSKVLSEIFTKEAIDRNKVIKQKHEED